MKQALVAEDILLESLTEQLRNSQGPEPEGSKIHEQATGWNSNYKSGKGVDTISSGIEALGQKSN